MRPRSERAKRLFSFPELVEDEECVEEILGSTAPVATSDVTAPVVEPHGLNARARVSRNLVRMDEGLLRQIRALVPSAWEDKRLRPRSSWI